MISGLRHCERSEATQKYIRRMSLDCFVAARSSQCESPPSRAMTAIMPQLSNTITLRSVLPAFMLAKPSLISDSFSLAEIQSSRCSLPRM